MLVAGCIHLPKKIKKKTISGMVNEIKKEFDNKVTVEINFNDKLIYYHQILKTNSCLNLEN